MKALAKKGIKTTNLYKQFGIVNIYKNFILSQLAFRKSLKEVRENIVLLTSMYSTRKTDIVFCIAIKLQNHKTTRNNLFYTLVSNKAVDNTVQQYQLLCNKYSLDKNIIRVYNLKSEKAAMLNNFKTAKANNCFVTTLTNTFLKKFQAILYIKSLQDKFTKHKQRGNPQQALIDMLLIYKMLQQIEDSNDPELENLYLQLCKYRKSGLAIEEMTTLKLCLNNLIAVVLSSADTVFYTLNISSRFNLFTNFKADFVVIDELYRATKIACLASFVFYTAKAYLLVGDPKQLQPILFSAEQEKHSNKIVQNSWYKQGLLLLYKCLDEIGHPVCYLCKQYYCQRNISIYLSTCFYYRLIKNASPTVLKPVYAIARYLYSLGIRAITNIMFLLVYNSRAEKENSTEL